jgi:hypothetical protein
MALLMKLEGMMNETRIYRQGDVLLIEATLPDGEAHEIARADDGRLVLAYGEATGHHHAIAEPDALLLQGADGTRYLWVDAPVQLRHEEHRPIPLQPGVFKIVIQREYVPRVHVADPVDYREVGD